MTVTREFLLPDLGEGLTEAELVRWLVAVGDSVAVDQPVVEVETAKAVVEVPSPYAGVVAVLHGEPGETVDVGRPLISIDEADARAATAQADARAATARAAEAYRTEERAGASGAGSGNVLIGYGTSEAAASGRKRRRKGAPAPILTALNGTPTHAPKEAIRVVSPLVRRLARDLGVDLHSVKGTGQDGLILRRDVDLAAQSRHPAAPATVPDLQPAAPDSVTGLGIASRTPVRGVRKAVAQAMSRSRTEIPEATVWVDVDATELVALREGLKRREPERAPSLLAFIARFALAGLERHPELNTRVETKEDGSQEIVAFDGVNLGFAAQTERGLVVPSIRGAHRMSARNLDAELRRLTALARDGKAAPADLTGSTFTLNNYGVFGVDGSAAIINYPEAAILGVGRILDRPWAVEGRLEVRKVVQLTLVFDHRVCDGGTAGGFLRFVADAVEHPGGILADL